MLITKLSFSQSLGICAGDARSLENEILETWRPASRCHGPRSGVQRDPQNVEGIAGQNPGRAGCGIRLVHENLEGSFKFFFPYFKLRFLNSSYFLLSFLGRRT